MINNKIVTLFAVLLSIAAPVNAKTQKRASYSTHQHHVPQAHRAPQKPNKLGEVAGQVGVVNGLAVRSNNVGHSFPIRATLVPGSGKLKIYGQLGKTMQESAKTAHKYIKSHANTLGIPPNYLKHHDMQIHIHGTYDGPSAGITMLTAMDSAYTNKKIDASYAMTGAVDSHGNVLPIGGLKEKVEGAKKAGIKKVLAPTRNARGIKIPSGSTITFVHSISQVLDTVLI